MKIKTSEIYEKYYGAVAGRFYTSDEKRRILALFSKGYGVLEGSNEFSELLRTTEAVERLAVESLVDCNNFLLIADSIPGRREIVKAVRAQKAYLEKAKSSGAVIYYSLLEWRTSVFKGRNDDYAAKLESAYIDYARGNLEGAVKYFEEVSENRAHLLSVEHLAIIYRERGMYYESLVKLYVLDGVMKEVLGIEEEPFIAELIADTERVLSENEISSAVRRADEIVKKSFSYGAGGRCAIGFRR